MDKFSVATISCADSDLRQARNDALTYTFLVYSNKKWR